MQRLELSKTNLLLELLVDGVYCILDGHALEVSGCDGEPEREHQVDLLDWRVDEQLFQVLLVVDR